ncbi:hypothetical protein GGR52DRAFT_387993 [Hypoxylon sp. FL1284]|nr:hypothetical protein GGR52DRAFT_387993 [Hypoxylon sp. FL1284]
MPVVKFRQYWDLVTANQRANAQHGVAMDDTYYISWVNLAYDQFAASEELDQARELRMAISRLRLSTTSGSFRRIISILLGCHRVTKIVCFGLGRITPSLSYEASGPKSAAEANNQRGRALMQHALALQARDRLRLPDDFSFDTLRHVELYAQDPAYSAADRAALQAFGFEVVGQHGAGGFALVDDNSLVITCHPSAPVTQILADIARPAAILTTADVDPIRTKKMHSLPLSSPLHFYDSPSPRTREMMREYKENTIEDPTNMISSTGLRMYIREAGSTDADMDMCPGF